MALCNLGFIMVSMAGNQKCPKNFSKSLKSETLTISVEQFMRYLENWFKAFYVNQALLSTKKAENWNFWQPLLEVSHTQFQQYLWHGFWNTWKSPPIALCKSSLTMDYYSWKSEVLDNFKQSCLFTLMKICLAVQVLTLCHRDRQAFFFILCKECLITI
jgi:hypothetical protein